MKLTAKMERWIETRLWNLRIENQPIHLKRIASELTGEFGINLSSGEQRNLEKAIDQIRYRVYKRHERRRIRKKELARRLGVHERLIERWFRAGWIVPGNEESEKLANGIILERDYYLRFIKPKGNGNEIPENPDVCITVVE